jgi:hypothetical protein
LQKTTKKPVSRILVLVHMGFFTSAVGILKTMVIAIGAGLGVWGGINLAEGYGNDNPGAKSQGIKQLMAGGGVILIGTQLIPQLASLF